jgi:tellurite resistance protein TehA-like permease
MLTFILILYFVVASIGIYLFTKLFSKNPPKLLIGIIHGMLGLFGISFLIIYTSFKQGDTPVISILIFVVAFFFGGGMFVMSVQGKRFPKAIAFIHIAIAVTGIFLLVKFWLR